MNQVNPITAAPHLRLVWPQWQGAGTESVRWLAPEFPFDFARRGYSVGTKVLQAVLPEHDGPTAIVPVEMGDIGLEECDGIRGASDPEINLGEGGEWRFVGGILLLDGVEDFLGSRQIILEDMGPRLVLNERHADRLGHRGVL